MNYTYAIIDTDSGQEVWRYNTHTEANKEAVLMNLEHKRTRFTVIKTK